MILSYSKENGSHIENTRQLLSYSLIHPACTSEERSQFTMWIGQLEEIFTYGIHQQNSEKSDTNCWQEKHLPVEENNHTPLHSTFSAPARYPTKPPCKYQSIVCHQQYNNLCLGGFFMFFMQVDII